MNFDMLIQELETLTESPGGVNSFRTLVCNLAVSGRLVEPNDFEPNAIESVPRRLKDSFSHSELVNWLQIPLAECVEIYNGNSTSDTEKNRLSKVSDGRPLVATKDVGYGFQPISLETGLKVPFVDTQYKIAPANAVLICLEGGSAGKKMGILGQEVCFGNKLFANVCKPWIDSKYLLICLLSTGFSSQFQMQLSGIIGGISKAKYGEIRISLPPLSEQKRIVSKVDELMALCDQLEKQQKHRDNLRTATRKSAIDAISTATTPEELETAWKRINNNWKVIADTPESVESLRGLILGLAVTDRLVESSNSQLSEHVMSFESPTNIWAAFSPKGWKCLSLEDASDQITDGTHQTPNYVETGVPFLSIKDISSGKLDFSRTRFISPKEHKKLALRVKPQRGDVLICRIGTLGRAISVDIDEEFSIFVSLGLIRPKEFVNPKFLAMLLNSPISYQQFDAIKAGGSHTVKLNLASLRKFVLWIPSMEVQELILSKVDELMALCDQLESELKARSEVAEKFARSVMRAA